MLMLDKISMRQLYAISAKVVRAPALWTYAVSDAANDQQTNYFTRNALMELRLRLERLTSPITLMDVFRTGKVIEKSSSRPAKAIGRAILFAGSQQVNLIIADRKLIYSKEEKSVAERIKLIYGLFDESKSRNLL